MQEIYQQQQNFQQPRPLVTQAFPTEWFVYWDNERAFKINETENDAESIIQNIIDIAGHNVHKLRYVFSQLEVNLNPKLFKQIIDNIIEQTQKCRKPRV